MSGCPMPGCAWWPVEGHSYPREALLYHVKMEHHLSEVVERLEDLEEKVREKVSSLDGCTGAGEGSGGSVANPTLSYLDSTPPSV